MSPWFCGELRALRWMFRMQLTCQRANARGQGRRRVRRGGAEGVRTSDNTGVWLINVACACVTQLPLCKLPTPSQRIRFLELGTPTFLDSLCIIDDKLKSCLWHRDWPKRTTQDQKDFAQLTQWTGAAKSDKIEWKMQSHNDNSVASIWLLPTFRPQGPQPISTPNPGTRNLDPCSRSQSCSVPPGSAH